MFALCIVEMIEAENDRDARAFIDDIIKELPNSAFRISAPAL